MLPSVLVSLLAPLLAYWTPPAAPDNELSLELRHLHYVSPSGHVSFASPRSASVKAAGLQTVKQRIIRVPRPSTETRSALGRGARAWSRLDDGGWEEDEVPGPDTSSRETLLTLAKMTSNAYYANETDTGWYDLSGNWTSNMPVGYEPDGDGFRGHVFATPDNSTVVLAIKGTSTGFIGGGGPTTRKDKLNDNLLFSCCCAHVDWTWTTVCGCYRGGWKCDQDCIEEALIEDSLFYPIGTNLYNNLTYLYPDSTIWLTGHSLGGALAALLGVTFGAPTVAFEAPGEKMAAQRLHLPVPIAAEHITHVYHTADPIAMGTCNGVLSSCALGGYAMESRCHQGNAIIYDTVTNCSWAVDIRTHGIANVIDKVLGQPWPPAEEAGREVPEPKPEEDCVECFSWEFGDFPKALLR
ncbi:unnamed protein product [Peniophora sp. CBMAI 1063]|nr:unnamed protein product [Peniophora sp. CBMAI 1063]